MEQKSAQANSEITVRVENIGGIDSVERTIQPGLTVLTGRNATNRTSFMQSLMAALGSKSDQISLKSNASKGSVVVDTDEGEVYTRTLQRSNGTVVMDGEPYTDEPELLDLYAFLLRENPVRQAVERQEDLHDILMRPLDTDEIEREIERRTRERERIDRELSDISEKKEALPSLEQRHHNLESELESLRESERELEEERDDLEEEQPAEHVTQRSDELDEKLHELETERAQIDKQIQRKKAKIEGERSEIESTTVPAVDWDDLEEKHDRLQIQLEELQTEIEEAQQIRSNLSNGLQAAQTLQNNSFSLDKALETIDDSVDIPNGPLLRSDDSNDTVTDESISDVLVQDVPSRCLACGSTLQNDANEQIIEQYKALNKGLVAKIHTLERKEANMQDELDDIEDTIQEHRRAIDRIERAEQSIDDTNAEIEQLREDRDAVVAEIDRLTSEQSSADLGSNIDETTKRYNAVRDELRNLRVEIDRTESELVDVTEKIDAIEDRVAAQNRLEEEREAIVERLEELRTKVEQTEMELVEQFNENIDMVLDLLEYKNIERIWIERTGASDQSVRSAENETTFDIHIVRKDADGVYECQLQHLSESERNVTGLIVALTGYLVHDVATHCPVILLDSVEMIDANRIAALVSFLSEQTEYLIAALLPEDTATVIESETAVTEAITIGNSPD
ncbi:archaea-specific SMC-related protein [Natrarchaeobius halalkaliphilus]|nr:archaea-specific SMC-related protein [Natrarchaeobius halalkaliphilus]